MKQCNVGIANVFLIESPFGFRCFDPWSSPVGVFRCGVNHLLRKMCQSQAPTCMGLFATNMPRCEKSGIWPNFAVRAWILSAMNKSGGRNTYINAYRLLLPLLLPLPSFFVLFALCCVASRSVVLCFYCVLSCCITNYSYSIIFHNHLGGCLKASISVARRPNSINETHK